MRCEVIIWSKFGGFRDYFLVQVGLIVWSKFVFSLFYSGFKQLFAHSIIILFCLCPIVWQLSKNVFLSKKGCDLSVLSLIFQILFFMSAKTL